MVPKCCLSWIDSIPIRCKLKMLTQHGLNRFPIWPATSIYRAHDSASVESTKGARSRSPQLIIDIILKLIRVGHLNVAPRMRSSGCRPYISIYNYIYLSCMTARPLSPQEGARSRSPQLWILVECLALWGERERSRRQYRSQASVFKPALFTEHSNTDKMKKRRTVADSVANIGESEDRDRCLGTSVAYLGVNTRP